jgi:hypothetical protein
MTDKTALENKIYNFKTKYPQGFTSSELFELRLDFPQFTDDQINDEFMGDTCMMIDNEIIHYHCDVYRVFATLLEL